MKNAEVTETASAVTVLESVNAATALERLRMKIRDLLIVLAQADQDRVIDISITRSSGLRHTSTLESVVTAPHGRIIFSDERLIHEQ